MIAKVHSKAERAVDTVQSCDACLGVIAQAQVLISCSVMRAYMIQHVAEMNRSRKFLVCSLLFRATSILGCLHDPARLLLVAPGFLF